MIYAGMKEKDLAFEWLERAFDERSGLLVYLKIDPRLDNLRADARFQSLLGRMNYPKS
jgi:hypothetical protein